MLVVYDVLDMTQRIIFLGLRSILGFTSENDGNGSLGAHDGDLSRRPGVVGVAAQVLGRHDVIGSAVGLEWELRLKREAPETKGAFYVKA